MSSPSRSLVSAGIKPHGHNVNTAEPVANLRHGLLLS